MEEERTAIIPDSIDTAVRGSLSVALDGPVRVSQAMSLDLACPKHRHVAGAHVPVAVPALEQVRDCGRRHT